MIENKIVIAAGVNGQEWLKSMALRGKPSFNLRIVSPLDIAAEELLCQGFSVGRTFVDDREAELMMQDVLASGNAYFDNGSLSDAQAIMSAMNHFRLYIESGIDELAGFRELSACGPVPEKNRALAGLFADYLNRLQADGKVDSIQLLRLAVTSLHPIQARIMTLAERPLRPLEAQLAVKLSGGQVNGTTISDLLSMPKEETSVKISSFVSAYGEVNEVEYILKSILAQCIPLDQTVIAVTAPAIYSQLFFDVSRLYNIPMTFGTGVPMMNSTAAALFVLICKWAEGGLFSGQALGRILNAECFNRKAVRQLIENTDEGKKPEQNPVQEDSNAESEDIGIVNVAARISSMIEIAGNLKLSMDAKTNKTKLDNLQHLYERKLAECVEPKSIQDYQRLLNDVAYTRSFFADVESGLAFFLKKYTRVRRIDPQMRKIDQAALISLVNNIEVLEARDSSLELIIESTTALLGGNAAAESSSEGHLHICSIDQAQGLTRKNLYIAGLSMAYFPGKQQENPIILDADYDIASGKWADFIMPLSSQRLKDRKKDLLTLLHAAAKCTTITVISFSNFNLADQKAVNPAGVLLELYQRAYGSDKSFEDLKEALVKVGFFDPTLFLRETDAIMDSNLRGNAVPAIEDYGRAVQYVQKKEAQKRPELTPYDGALETSLLDRVFSPTALEAMLGCPYSVFLSRILGISEPEKDPDGFVWLDAAAVGSLVHSAVEIFSNAGSHGTKQEQLAEIRKITDALLDEAAIEIVPRFDTAKERETIYRILAYFVESDPGNPVASSEMWLDTVKINDIQLHGQIDRIETTPAGEKIVVDYKTGRHINQVENNAATCLQALLYCHMLAAQNLALNPTQNPAKNATQTPARGEYRYLRKHQTVSCSVLATQQDFADIMDVLADLLRRGAMPMAVEEDTCKYCYLNDICGRRTYSPELLAAKWNNAFGTGLNADVEIGEQEDEE